jgi:trans-aconitate 2-methyltransferase
MQYSFGHSDLAAQRLEVLADVFASTTVAFLNEMVTERPRVAVDLGCGPGHTTHLIARALPCELIVGLDNSEHFIALAQQTATDRVSFRLHDVTAVPFPVDSIDFLFGRFLLSHLEDPLGMVMDWITQLRPGGLLLVEEPERINTRNAVFRQYLDIVEAMMFHRGGGLYVGRDLEGLKRTDDLKQRISGIRPLSVQTHRAAAMFYLNIQTWKHQPFVKENYQTSDIEALEGDLQQLATRTRSEMEIQWGLRQIVFERT